MLTSLWGLASTKWSIEFAAFIITSRRMSSLDQGQKRGKSFTSFDRTAAADRATRGSVTRIYSYSNTCSNLFDSLLEYKYEPIVFENKYRNIIDSNFIQI